MGAKDFPGSMYVVARGTPVILCSAKAEECLRHEIESVTGVAGETSVAQPEVRV